MTRRFRSDAIDRQSVYDLIDIARRAPSAGFSQGSHFLIIDGPALAEFWSASGAGPWFEERQHGVLDAPMVVLPLADPSAYAQRYARPDKAGHGLEDEGRWPVPYWYADTAMAVQNLLLLVEATGLGALYFGLFGDERHLLDQLGVPEHVRALGAIALGHRHPDDRPSGSSTRLSRRAGAEVIHIGRW